MELKIILTIGDKVLELSEDELVELKAKIDKLTYPNSTQPVWPCPYPTPFEITYGPMTENPDPPFIHKFTS